MDTIYRDRANGRFEYWHYSDGIRVPVSAAWALRHVARKTARLVIVV